MRTINAIQGKSPSHFMRLMFGATFLACALCVAAFANAPNKPTNLNATFNGSSNTLTLTWNAPTGGGTPSGYYVYYDEDIDSNIMVNYERAPNFRRIKTITGNATSTTINRSDLPFYAVYRVFRVAAYNASGESPKSEAEYLVFTMDYVTGDSIIVTGDGRGDFMFRNHAENTHISFDIENSNDTIHFDALDVKIPLDNTAQPSYSLVNAPQGMTVNTTNGKVMWIAPRVIGRYTATHITTWETMRLERELTIDVFRTPDLSFADRTSGNTYTLPNSTYTFTHTAVHRRDPNAKIKYSLNGAPQGMTVDTNTGKVSYAVGNLDENETFTYIITASAENDSQPIAAYITTTVLLNRIQAFASGSGYPVIVNEPIPSYLQIGAYASDLAGEDTAFTFTLLNAPQGMTIERNPQAPFAAYVQWTPTQIGVYTFKIIVTGNRAWGADTVELSVKVEDVIDIVNEAPRFTSVNQKMTVTPKITYRSNGTTPTGLKFVLRSMDTYRFDFDNGFIPDSLGYENGTTSFDSTTGKIEWTPAAEGYIYATGYIEKDGQMISGGHFGFYTYAYDFSKRDTSEVAFINYPVTSIKPGQAWSFTPTIANRYTGAALNATYKLAAGAPQGISYDSTTQTFMWTPQQQGMYSLIIEAEASNGSTISLPFMVLVANYIEPQYTSGSFSMLPWNWAYVGRSYDSTFDYYGLHSRFTVETLDSLQGTDELNIDEVRYKLEAGAPGLALDSITGKVTWTPQQQGVWDVVVKAYHPTRGGVARVHLSFFAFDMEPEAVGILVRGRRNGTTSVKEEPMVTSMTNMTAAPLPATETVTITLKEQRSDIPVVLRITDMNGNTVYQSIEQPLSGGRYPINLDRLAQGTYLLTAEQANKRSATPLVIVR